MLIRKSNEIIAEILDYPIKDLHPEQHLCYDLLADSLALMDLLIGLEETFGFKLEQEQPENINYVKDIHQLVTQYGRYPLPTETNSPTEKIANKN